MKKILHILVLPKLAGSQKISLEILKALPDDEFEKWVLFSADLDVGDKNECKIAFEKAGVKVIFSSKLKREICLSDVGAIIEIYNICKRERFDIVHTHSTKPGILGRIASSMAKVPLVIHTVHGVAFHKYIKLHKRIFYFFCEMFASFFCHKIILVNKYYSRYFGLFRNKIFTIYNGLDFSQLPLLERKDNVACKILFVGRLDEPKDPVTLLEVAKVVIAKHPEVRFTLVGDGEKLNECRNFIAESNMFDNVSLEGWQNNVSRYYVSHDIFFAPSIFESFGLMFLEAGYYNLPTVATNVEGIPEVIKNGETGLLTNPREVQSLADNLLYLIENRKLRLKMGNNSYKRVTDLFSTEKMTSQYLKVYNDL